MGKRELVILKCKKNKYRLCIDDVLNVYTAIRKKRPPIPSFERETEDGQSDLEAEKKQIA